MDKLTWYQDAKFGLFIHWGAYSVAGAEASWSMMTPKLAAALFRTQVTITEAEYTALPGRFNPADFDPDAWVRLAQEAGMRYIVFTAKHHDGFCMFDAPGTDYKITNTPYGKDICLELAQACARHGMPLGFYYSPPDMHHPAYRDTSKPVTANWTGEPRRSQWPEYLDYMESHIRKLLTDYGDVRILWFDGLTNHGKYDPERFHKLVHALSPHTLINDRLGEDYDFICPEQLIPTEGIPARSGKPNPSMDPGGDGFFRLISALSTLPLVGGWLYKQMTRYAEGEFALTKTHQEPFPAPERFQPWETCMTMGSSWAYNPTEPRWKPPAALVRNLVEVTSRGGNYLLNVGPTPAGTFPPEAVERLRYIGRWLKTYNRAIYGATYTPLQGQAWGRATRRGDRVYLHVFDWPASGELVVEPFPGRAHAVSLFAGQALTFNQTGPRLAITLPSQAPDPDVSVLAVAIDPSESGWSAYSAPVSATTAPKRYIQSQATASFIINAVLNGLIALASYGGRGPIPYADAAVDILISVFIITFLTAWIVVGGTRGEYRKGNLTLNPTPRRGPKLPAGAARRGLVIALACTIGFGGIVLAGLLRLVSPNEVSNWAYIVLKTLYTGASGALAAALAILSVMRDENGQAGLK